MKKVLLSVLAVMAFGFANAQDVKFGAKGGLNLSTIKFTFPSQQGNPNQDSKMLLGFHVGGFAEISLSDKFSFQPELLFSMEGAKFESSETYSQTIGTDVYTYSDKETSTLRTSYISVPLLAKFKATEKLFFVAGPQIGFLMSAKQDYSSTSTETFNGNTTTDTKTLSGIDAKNQFKSMSYALDLGAGYFFTDNLFSEVRYNLGLSNDAKPVTETSNGQTITYQPTYKASTIQFSLGYKF